MLSNDATWLAKWGAIAQAQREAENRSLGKEREPAIQMHEVTPGSWEYYGDG